MIKEWLEEYKPRNEEEATDALREIMQDIAWPLYRGPAFLKRQPLMAGRPCAYFTGWTVFPKTLVFPY